MIDPNWDLLDRYLARHCTPAERERVDRWLAESPANRQALANLWTAVALAEETAVPEREAAILASLRREWGAPTPAVTLPTPPTPPLQLVPVQMRASRWLVAAKIAAAAALAAGVGLLAGR